MTDLTRLDGPATATAPRLHDVNRGVLGATLPLGGLHRDPPTSGPPVGEATSPAG